MRGLDIRAQYALARAIGRGDPNAALEDLSEADREASRWVSATTRRASTRRLSSSRARRS